MQVSDLADLLGTPVWSADGTELGRIGAVHVPYGNVQPLLVTFPAASDTPYVAPLFGARLDEAGLVLAYSTKTVSSGPAVDSDATLSIGEVGYVLSYYQERFVLVGAGTITDRQTGTGDVAAENPDVRQLPPVPGIDERTLPPIVVIKPGFTGTAD